MKHTTQGQSTVEYVVVTAVVIAALLTTTIYAKRGKMGDLGRAADQVGSQFNPHQYSGVFRTRFDAERAEKLNVGFLADKSGTRTSAITAAGEQQYRKGSEKLTQSRVGCEELFHQTDGPIGGEPVVGDPCPAPDVTYHQPGDVTVSEMIR